MPAGTLGIDEDPKDCAFRELKEETGYQASSMACLGEFFCAPGWSTYRLFAFIGRDIIPGNQNLEKDESIQVYTKSVSEVNSMIACVEIVDAKTITALSLYGLKRDNLEFST